MESLGGLVLTSSLPDNIEVNALGADKGHALEALAQRLGIPREKVMALGTSGNDVTMLEYAGVSVCMGDGSDSAKAAAKYLSAPHTEDGLAKAIRKFALRKLRVVSLFSANRNAKKDWDAPSPFYVSKRSLV